jgi:hypothetical protein
MNLSPVANPAWETIRGVKFAMLHGPTLVEVLVTNAALDYIALPTPGPGGRLACFNGHREKFEQAANAKYHSGQLDEEWMLIVEVGDLKTISNS